MAVGDLSATEVLGCPVHWGQNLLQELFSTVVLWCREEMFWFALFKNLTVINKDHPISHFACKTHFMGDTHHGHARLGQILHHL